MNRKIILIGQVLLLYTAKMFAQESVNTVGGNAIGNEGTVSYSVGQIAYTMTSNNNGAVAQGVQQSFDIKLITGIEETNIQLVLSAYPNPTTNILILHTEHAITRALSYQLLNTNGTLLEKNKIINQEMTINTQQLDASTYLLQILENEKTIKTFKIIKQ